MCSVCMMLTFPSVIRAEPSPQEQKTSTGQAAACLLFLWSTQTDHHSEFPQIECAEFSLFTLILHNHKVFFFFLSGFLKTLNWKPGVERPTYVTASCVFVSDRYCDKCPTGKKPQNSLSVTLPQPDVMRCAETRSCPQPALVTDS